jgi:hypothetical protein
LGVEVGGYADLLEPAQTHGGLRLLLGLGQSRQQDPHQQRNDRDHDQ